MKLAFKFTVRIRQATYGDGAKFYEYRIFAWQDGRAVGAWGGPRRSSSTMDDARADGRKMIETLKTHELFSISVTTKDIDNGEAHSCCSCAISQSLWRLQESMGLPRLEFDFRVEPYGFMVDCQGIVLKNTRTGEEISTGARGMPDLVMQSARGLYTHSMMEWAMEWDEWAGSRYMSRSEWRETYGKEKDDSPYRPSPCGFVLDLTSMREMSSVEAMKGPSK